METKYVNDENSEPAYIWRPVYRPFQMGGRTHYNVKTKIENPDIVELGKGFRGIVVEAHGKTWVFDKVSGGLVGNTVQQVMDDISSCDDIQLMEQQVADARKYLDEAKAVSIEEFFKL